MVSVQKKSHLCCLVLFLFSATISCASKAIESDQPETNEQSIEVTPEQTITSQIEIIQKTHQIPALAVRVLDQEQESFAYTQGVRAVDRTMPVGYYDIWHLGSCTKNMTAIQIARLVDLKKIGWKSTLSTLVGSSVKLHPSLKNVTIEMLLSHRAGLKDPSLLPDADKFWAEQFQKSSQDGRDLLVRSILAEPATYKPGSQEIYSNSAYVTLGWLIERITRESWETNIQKEIFQKLKMNQCGFGPTAHMIMLDPDQPWGHTVQNEKLVSVAPDIMSDNPKSLGPAGTVHCPLNDWGLFLTEIKNISLNKSTLLSQKSSEKILSKLSEDSRHSLSTFLRIERSTEAGPIFLMSGSNTFNYAFTMIDPKKDRIVMVTTNAPLKRSDDSATEIIKAIVQLPSPKPK